MKFIFCFQFLLVYFSIVFLAATPAHSSALRFDIDYLVQKGVHYELKNGHRLWTEVYIKDPNKPVVVMLNGLTYNTKNYVQNIEAMLKRNMNVIAYDMWGMGQSNSDQFATSLESSILYTDQTKDLNELLLLLKKEYQLKDGFYLAGLSYGGAIAGTYALMYPHSYPDLVKGIFQMAPYTEPLATQDMMINFQMVPFYLWLPYYSVTKSSASTIIETSKDWVEMSFPEGPLKNYYLSYLSVFEKLIPFIPETKDDLYNFFLRVQVFTTYSLMEQSLIADEPSPEVLLKRLDDIFKMVVGIRKLNLTSAISMLSSNMPIHLFIATADEYLHYNPFYEYLWISKPVLIQYWDSVPQTNQATLSLINSHHKMTEEFPNWIAKYMEVLITTSNIPHGSQIKANPNFDYIVINGEITTSLDDLLNE